MAKWCHLGTAVKTVSVIERVLIAPPPAPLSSLHSVRFSKKLHPRCPDIRRVVLHTSSLTATQAVNLPHADLIYHCVIYRKQIGFAFKN